MMLAAILALCAACAAGAAAAAGEAPDVARRYALDAVHYRSERDNRADGVVDDLYFGLKYFTKSGAQPFFAVLPRLDENTSYSAALWKPAAVVDAVEDEIARSIYARLCKEGSPLVVDVGSNIGWYSLLALAHGCRVVAIDGGADHLANLNMSLALNGWLDRARLYHAIASAEHEVVFNGWSAESASSQEVSAYAKDANIKAKSFASQTPVALDDIITEEVAYLKVDVESHEPSVFRSARRLIETRAVKYVLFEWTYYIGGKYHFNTYAEDVLRPLFGAGYRCFLAAGAREDQLEVTGDTLLALIRRLHAHCAAQDFPTGQRWCMDNVVCARHDQLPPMDAPLLSEGHAGAQA